jgi:hypothetical protein
MNFRQYYIKEAFKEGDFYNALGKIVDYLAGKLGTTLHPYPGPINFVNAYGKQNGEWFFVGPEAEKAIRFNWNKSGKSRKISSIDVWTEKGITPNKHLELNQLSVVRVLPELVKIIKGEDLQSFYVFDEAVKIAGIMIKEAAIVYNGEQYKNKGEAVEALANAGMSPKEIGMELDVSPAYISKRLKKLNISAGLNETRIDANFRQAIKQIDVTETQVEDYFVMVEDYIRKIVAGAHRFGIVSGAGGLGKSFSVEKVMEQYNLRQGHDYISLSGGISAPALFRKCFQYHDKLIVLDDADGIFQDSESMNLLKAMTDTQPKRISWGKSVNDLYSSLDGIPVEQLTMEMMQTEYESSGNTPTSFVFSGKTLILTNKDVRKLDKEGAVLTRSAGGGPLNLKMSESAIWARIRSVARKPEFMPSVSILGQTIKLGIEEKMQVVDELAEMYSDSKLMANKQLSLRALIDAINSKYTPGLKTDWKTLQSFTGEIGFQ